jgi:hypothetical protein
MNKLSTGLLDDAQLDNVTGGGDWPFNNHYTPDQYLAKPPAPKKAEKKNDFTVGDP